MALGKRLINTGAAAAACLTETTDIFGDSSGVALYSLDYDASDESGLYDGSPTNVDFGVGGQINYGARFNGSSSKIDTGFAQNTSNAFTWSLWFKADASQSSNAMIMDTTSTTNPFPGVGIGLSTATDLRAYQAGSASRFTHTNNTITSDTWVHVAYTHDGSGNFNFYINNQLSASGNYTSNLNSSQNILLGDSVVSSWNNFNGDIDQVRIFSKALSSDEVSTLYAETACVYTSTTDIVNYPTGTTPIAYYKLDNSSEDYSTGGNDGTDTNVEYRFGRFGQAAVFNGSSSYIDISNFPNSIFKDSTNGYTVSFWFKRESGTSSSLQAFFGTAIQTKALNVYFRQSDNLFQIQNGSASAIDITGGFTYDDGNWHHFVLTDTKVYIDGSEIMTYTGNYPSTFTDGQTFHIGSRHSASRLYYGGKIDQVRIYDAALTSSQVTELYNEKPEVDTSNFKTVLYEGNNSTQYISNVGFQPDLVWVKSRDSSSYDHNLYDSVRGELKRIKSNTTSAEDSNGKLSSFDANGFSLIAGGDANASGQSMVAWCWKGSNADAVSNTDGDITSSVSANTAAGFSIVSYTGTGNASHTVGHGLDDKPELIILKRRSGASISWFVVSSQLGNNEYLLLDANNSKTTDSGSSGVPSSVNNNNDTTFGFRSGSSSVNNVNQSGGTFIAYCFHSVSGYSKIGSYEGNAGSNTIYTTDDGTSTGSGGFEPSFVMFKNIEDTTNSHWLILDNKRSPVNPREDELYANIPNAEQDLNRSVNFVSNGFELTSNTYTNRSGIDYIYMAFK